MDHLADPNPLRVLATPWARSALGGEQWLGHPLHPALTDVPIGFWTASMVIDLWPGPAIRDAGREASTLFVGLGLLAAVPTALAGASDASVMTDEAALSLARRHALCNGVAVAGYAASWWLRRRGRHLAGVVCGVAGGAAASVAAAFGGRLAFPPGP